MVNKMILVNTDYITGKKLEMLSLVKGSTIQSKNIGRDITQGLKTLIGGELGAYTEMMNDARALATQRMTDEQIEVIKGVNEEYEAALRDKDKEKMIQSDTHFHNLITQGSGNEYLIDILLDLQEQVLRFRYIYFKSTKRAEEVVNEHRNILEALENRDAEAARTFCKEHIKKLREAITQEKDFHPEIINEPGKAKA